MGPKRDATKENKDSSCILEEEINFFPSTGETLIYRPKPLFSNIKPNKLSELKLSGETQNNYDVQTTSDENGFVT